MTMYRKEVVLSTGGDGSVMFEPLPVADGSGDYMIDFAPLGDLVTVASTMHDETGPALGDTVSSSSGSRTGGRSVWIARRCKSQEVSRE